MHGVIFNRWTLWKWFTSANYFVCLSIHVAILWYSVSMTGSLIYKPLWLIYIYDIMLTSVIFSLYNFTSRKSQFNLFVHVFYILVSYNYVLMNVSIIIEFLCKWKEFWVSLLFNEYKKWYRAPMMSLFSSVITYEFTLWFIDPYIHTTLWNSSIV